MSDVWCKSPNQLNIARLKETGIGQHSVLYPDIGYPLVDLAAVSSAAFGSLFCFCSAGKPLAQYIVVTA